jgi:hypothetical protein
MSTAIAPLPVATLEPFHEKVTPIYPRTHQEASLAAVARPERRVRRRGDMHQGRALETLGHAVEYLMDSRLFLVERATPKAEQDALQILMRMSRAVFLECPEVVSVWTRFGQLCRRSLERG